MRTHKWILILVLFALFPSINRAATLIWTNTAGGDWNAASNWKPNQVPGATDTAIITNNGTYGIGISDTSTAVVSNLTMGGTSGTITLDIGGQLTINGAATGNSNVAVNNDVPGNAEPGLIFGTGTFVLGGPLTWTGYIGSPNTLSLFQFNGGSINDMSWTGGPLVNTGSLSLYGGFYLYGNTSFSNAPSGIVNVVEIYNYITNEFADNATFNNAGLMVVEAPYGLMYSQSVFNNTGTVMVTNNSTLSLSGGGTNSGQIIVASNSVYCASNGVFQINSTITGAGTFQNYSGNTTLGASVSCNSFQQYGTAVITGAINATNTTLVGTTTTFTNGASLSGALTVGSTVNFVGTGLLRPSTLYLGNGLIAGTDPVDSTTFTWSGGTISGIVQCAGGAITGLESGFPRCILNGGKLVNTGLLTVQNTYYVPNISEFYTQGAWIISNAPSAEIKFIGTISGLIDSGNGSFINAGNVTFTNNYPSDVGTFTIASLLNSGTVATISNAVLNLENGATNSGQIATDHSCSASLSGALSFLPNSLFSEGSGLTVNNATGTVGGTNDIGGTANFSSSTVSFTGGGVFSNAVNVTSGTVSFNGSNSIVGVATFSGGTVNFAGNASSTNSSLVLSGSTVNVTNGCNLSISGSVTLSSGSFNLNGAGTVNALSFVLDGGTLTGTQNFQVNGPMTWTSGNISGPVSCAGGSINVSASSSVYEGGQLINTGTLNWTPNSGPRTGIGTVISNAASGIIFATLNGNSLDNYVYGGTVAFYNAGQIIISGASSSGAITEPFYNTGTLSISNGTFSLADGGTNSATISLTAGATLINSLGTFVSAAGAFITGTGNFTVNGGTFTNNGALNVNGTWTFANGTSTINGTTTITGNPLVVNGGVVNFYGTGDGGVWPFGNITLNNGSIGGTTPVADSGPLNWSGAGTIFGTVTCNGGSVNVSASGAVENGGQLINNGILTWTPNGGPRTGGSLAASVISNSSSGIINVTLNGNNIDSFVYGGNGAFYNAGQINISGAGQSGFFTDPFYNSGTLTISSGTLSTTDGGTNSGIIAGGGTLTQNNGTFNFGGTLNLTGTLNLSSGTANMIGSNSATGLTMNLNGATANFNSPANGGVWPVGTLNLSNGSLSGTNLVSASTFIWTASGTIFGNVSCNGGSVNVSASGAVENGGQLINNGMLTWTPNGGPRTGGSLATSVISNSSSGIINVTLNGNNIDSFVYGGNGAFYNAGQINISGAGQSGFFTDPFYNSGTLTISSGTLSTTDGGTNSGIIAGGGTLTQNNGTFNYGGTMNLTGTLNLTSGTANITGGNSATSVAMNINGATVNFNSTANNGAWPVGALNFTSGTISGTNSVSAGGGFNWTSGGTIFGNVICNGGSINVPGSGALENGGQLFNTGSLTWTPNSGPRTGGSGLTVISNSPSGIINVALNGNNIDNFVYGGTTAFYNAGQLNVSGVGQTGFLTDPFYNTGTLYIQSGTLNVTDGAYLTNGTLNFGAAATNNYGKLNVSGAVGLTGTLALTTNGSYSPQVGDSFALMTYGSKSNTFTGFNLPSTVSWQKNYGTTLFSLSASILNDPTNVTLILIKPPFRSNEFNFIVNGPLGSNYTVQVCTNLSLTNWTTLSNYVSSSVTNLITDTNTFQQNPTRFYRAYIH